jgi:hypothetical protein
MRSNNMRRRILSICYSIGWTQFDDDKKKMVVNMDKLNAWLLKYGYLHKPLNKYSRQELPLLVTQFEKLETTVL